MKVVSVNAFDLIGGAGKAAYRLHNGLLNKKINSVFLVQKKISIDYSVLTFNHIFYKYFRSLRWRFSSLPLFFYRKRKNIPYSTSFFVTSSGFVNKINSLNPDLVHLHWIAGGMMQIEELSKIKAPIVWTLHDCWPFTGGCHIVNDCENYLHACGSCKALNSNNLNDISNWINKRKEKAYTNKTITFIGVSNWISNLAKQSSLLKNQNVVTIPNIINLNQFKNIDKKYSREKFGIPINKKIILFGAYGALKDPNKGCEYFLEALKLIKSEDVEILIFGNDEKPISNDLPFKVTYLGVINSDTQLNYAYSSADLMVVPSIQESFGQTAIEAMAAGTPVVCFDTSGLKDIVDHKVNGYRATCYHIVDLANGIDWVLNNDNIENIQKLAREKIVNSFDSNLVVDKYIDLYNSIINKKVC